MAAETIRDRTHAGQWDADEILFFANWRRELEKLHATLSTVAIGRPNLLRRARNLYLRFGHRLNQELFPNAKWACQKRKSRRFREAGHR